MDQWVWDRTDPSDPGYLKEGGDLPQGIRSFGMFARADLPKIREAATGA